MLYFIPAWYQKNEWRENEQYWYARRMRTEFDDTVKHIQLFHRSQAYPFQVMLLSFAPNFRHFLHRQSVFRAPYWSCFDAIQEVKRKKVVTFSVHNLNWPEHTEFIYSPFALVAQLHGERYAQVEFGEDGNLIQVDMYQEGKINRRNIYDDRGFVSSTILFENGNPVHQDYLTDKGVRKIRQVFSDGHVEVNPKYPDYLLVHQGQEYRRGFVKKVYKNMDEVVQEVLSAYLELLDKDDLFCIAMHEQHNAVLQETLKNRKKILSFFQDRYALKNHPAEIEMIEQADYIITDSQDNLDKIKALVPKELHITDITPFDSRVDFGISQQLNVQKILVPVDGMDDMLFAHMIRKLGTYMLRNENVRIHLFTRQADVARKRLLLERTREALSQAGLEEGWAAESTKTAVAENMLDAMDEVPVKFFVEQCVSELEVSKCIREQRLVVDMRENTEVYLQITAISMGIPQIVSQKTQFVEHQKNGMVLEEIDNLPESMAFYLENLTSWNEAMVHAYEIGKKYTTRVLIEKWKEVIDFVGNDSSITAG